jgi:hypothetical protein
MPFRRHRSAAGSDLTATLIGWVPTTADITLTFRSPWQGDLSKCPSLEVKTTDLPLPGQLGKRDIVIDTAATFAPTNSTLMRRCSDFGGACTFPPVPPATCSRFPTQLCAALRAIS